MFHGVDGYNIISIDECEGNIQYPCPLQLIAEKFLSPIVFKSLYLHIFNHTTVIYRQIM